MIRNLMTYFSINSVKNIDAVHNFILSDYRIVLNRTDDTEDERFHHVVHIDLEIKKKIYKIEL